MNRKNWIRNINIVLMLVLVMSLMTPANMVIAAQSATTENGTTIALYKKNAQDNVPFLVTNMFPGDMETKNYHIQVSHRGTVLVRFRADIRPGYEKLAEVLKSRVVLRSTGEILYEGLLRDMPASLDHVLTSEGNVTDELDYEITIYLETSVGNEYQNKELIADFKWWVVDSSNVSDEPDMDGKNVGIDKIQITGKLTSPKTGQSIWMFMCMWLMAGVSICLLFMLARHQRRDKDDAS